MRRGGVSAPQSLRRFATQGFPPLWRCWDRLLLAACVAFEDFDWRGGVVLVSGG